MSKRVHHIGDSARTIGVADRQDSKVLHDDSARPALEQAPAVIWTTDAALKITSNWGALLRQLDMTEDTYIGKTLFECLKTDDPSKPFIAGHLQALAGESVTLEAEYLGRTFRLCIEPLRNAQAQISGTVGVALDVTAQKRQEESIRHQALHDALTGLANYRALVEVLDKELQRSDRTGRPFSVMLLDMDGLKQINDRHGHLVGSRALCRLAAVLRKMCRSIDTPTRYGGDEFGILLVETDRMAALHVADRIALGVSEDTEKPDFTVSAGIAVYPKDGSTIESLLASADQDLYRNKLRKNLQAGTGEASPAGSAGRSEIVDERRRSERLPLDIPLVVRGESVQGDFFQEETFTISVSAHGALLILAARVKLGQLLVLKNRQTQYEEQGRVRRFNPPYGGLSQVAVEFSRPAPEFWRVESPPTRWKICMQGNDSPKGKLVR